MHAVDFPQTNCTFVMPKEMEGNDLRVFNDGKQIISAWRPTPQELVRLNMGEPLFLFVIGQVVPPMGMQVGSPFETAPPHPHHG